MNKITTTKIMSGILISFGTILTFLMLKGIIGMSKSIAYIFAYTPAELWTTKHTMSILVLLIFGGAITYLGMTFGLGNINTGIKNLKALNAQHEINEMLKELREKTKGIKN